jgi:hypothetical protein
MKKVLVKVIKECELGIVGFEKSLPYLLAEELVKSGYCDFVIEESKSKQKAPKK